MAITRNRAGQLYSTADGRWVEDQTAAANEAALRDPLPELTLGGQTAAVPDASKGEVEAFAARISNRPFGSDGFTVDIDGIYPWRSGDGPWSTEFSGIVRDAGGEAVGSFTRTFDGELGTVAHNNLYIDEDFQGTGFATEFNAAAFELYAEMGYTAVTTITDDDGGYVWAKAGSGFEFNSDHDMADGARLSIAQSINRHAGGPDLDVLLAMADEFRSGDGGTTIHDIAALRTKENPNLGKDILTGINWPGIKRFAN
ncbi:hypothetical protein [Leifsonia sp. Leaf264]|uniref:hypothetical protein n=1 Tax=Leifsonia sp. Leaf264 TaxID=1736314 RepID=UPI0006FB2F6B|nr:hypothetical protein [Leifsonia sp. Leaf264]KQO98648.1 hypothetical protein ASF30_11335 [Leifsonia sp. Leaf264]